jgi:hypothetical protein
MKESLVYQIICFALPQIFFTILCQQIATDEQNIEIHYLSQKQSTDIPFNISAYHL